MLAFLAVLVLTTVPLAQLHKATLSTKSMQIFAFLAVLALTIVLLVLLPKNNFKRVATLSVVALLTFFYLL